MASVDVQYFHDLALAAIDAMAADVDKSMAMFYEPGQGDGS